MCGPVLIRVYFARVRVLLRLHGYRLGSGAGSPVALRLGGGRQVGGALGFEIHGTVWALVLRGGGGV